MLTIFLVGALWFLCSLCVALPLGRVLANISNTYPTYASSNTEPRVIVRRVPVHRERPSDAPEIRKTA